MKATPHGQPFNAYPLAQLAACFACGVLSARVCGAPLATCVAACGLASAACVMAWRRGRAGAATGLVCAAFVAAGASFEAAERRGGAAAHHRVRGLVERGQIGAGEAVELEGVLARAPEVAPDGFYVALRAERVRGAGFETGAAGAVELFAPVRDRRALARYEALELRRGARVRVLAELGRADEFRNPGVEPRAEFLRRRGFDAAGFVESPLLVERLDDEPVLLPLHWLDVWRASLHERLTENFSIETAGVLQAAILGNRHGLARASGESFREGGTFHVIVISGMHISFVGGLALWVARRLTRRRAWQFAASACLLWAYTVAVGAEVSVVRAALMFTTVALAPLVARRGETLNALGGACLVLLAWRPSELFDPSFQLTFLSVLGIVALGWPLARTLRDAGAWRPTRETPHPPDCPRWWRAIGESLYWSARGWEREQSRQAHSCRLFKTSWAARLERWRVQRVLRYAALALLVTLGTQAVLLPFQVVYFHRLSPASLLLNVFTGLLMAACCLGALAVVALAALSPALAAPLAWLCERACWLMTHAVEPFSRAGVASFRVPEYTGAAAAVYALYYAPLVLLLVALARWQPLKLKTTHDATDAATASASSEATSEARAATGDAHEATRESPRATHESQRAARGARKAAGGLHEGIRKLSRAHSRLRKRLSVRADGRRCRRVAWAALALSAAVIVAHPLSASRADGRLRLDFLDVGQGDAALLTLPDGTTLLVDAGGRPRFNARTQPADSATFGRDDSAKFKQDDSATFQRDDFAPFKQGDAVTFGRGDSATFERDARGIGERVVSEFLWRRGLSRVDYVLATHAHADHVEGLADVARNFAVRAALAGRAPAGVAEFDELAAALRAADVPLRLVGRGDALRFGAVTLEVLWPPRADEEDTSSHRPEEPRDGRAIERPAGGGHAGASRGEQAASSGNDDSVVLRVRYGARCFLLTGDIERAAESQLVAAGDELRCDVLKVAHHGSKSSSSHAFVAATRPRYAVITVGASSPYGHPDAAVVARWRAAGARVLQTGLHGMITFSTDGRDLRIETYARE